MPTRSYLSQSELPVTVGLGADSRIEELTVTWPNGNTQKVQPAATDTTQIVVEDQP